VRTIVDGLPEETCVLAVTPSHLVGMMGVEDFSKCDWGWKQAHFWATPRAYGPTEVKLSISPAIPSAPLSCYRLRAWGDFAACSMTPWNVLSDGGLIDNHPDHDNYMLITQLSTWKMWRLDQPDGHGFAWDAVTITPTHFYIGEHLDDVNDEALLRTLYRYELSKIDTWAKAVPTP
jgi:hypothetical protein